MNTVRKYKLMISLHIPKAGGASIRKVLQTKFKNSFLDDYDDIPLNKTESQRIDDVKSFQNKNASFRRLKLFMSKTKCIHGHFLAMKYKEFIHDDKVVFISWFRDPLERLASHYHYWQRAYDADTSAILHKKVVEEKWSFEAFCFSPELQNLHALFLKDFPLEGFNFIGITENFSEDIHDLNRIYLGLDDLHIPYENMNKKKKSAYFSDLTFMSKLKLHHALDYEIYNKALKLRAERT